MSFTIKSKTIGRLKSLTDLSQGIETDLDLFPTYKLCIIIEYNETPIKYAVIIDGVNIDFSSAKLTTYIDHRYILTFVNDVWNVVETKDIDTTKFPNLKCIIADNVASFIDPETGNVYDYKDSFCYEDDLDREIQDTTDPLNPVSFEPKRYEQKFKSSLIPYFHAIMLSNEAQTLIGKLLLDISNRF